jgi:hypothetical protein
LITEFIDVFKPLNNPIRGEKFKIILKPNSPPSKIYNARPVPYHWEEKLKAELDRMVEEDIIEEVTHATEWCHALVCTVKRTGSYGSA